MQRLRVILTIFLSLLATEVFANPSISGETGLVVVPSAETLDAGNICVGLWGIGTGTQTDNALTLPASLTLGIGSFWEIYGSYPNLLFNGDEDRSGRGYAEIGTKLRFLGTRSSPLKAAVDLFVQREISEDPDVDGTTHGGGRIITSYSTEQLGVHGNLGYLFTGSPANRPVDDEILYGFGIDYTPATRMRFTAELTGSTGRFADQDAPLEGLLGLQYYISPHLTLNLAGGLGLSDASPDWRAVAGLTACQGVGTYIKPVPRLGGGDFEGEKQKKQEPAKIRKIIPISPLLISSLSQPAPVSTLEVPLGQDREDIVIKPYGKVTLAAQAANAPVAVAAASEEVALGQGGEEVRLATRSVDGHENVALEYTLSRLEGVTPLYSVDVKGQNFQVASAAHENIPEAMTVYRKFRFPDVSFDFDQWNLSAEGKKALSEVAEQIRRDKRWVYLRIDGHTDNIGSAGYNMDLSLKRAISVASYLIAREGIDPTRLFVKGLGKSRPIGDNKTAEGRKFNRRGEILFLIAKEE